MGEESPPVVPVRHKEQVEGALKLIENLHLSGAMSDGAYYKCLVSLAYEFAMVDEDQLALTLLMKAPPEYYKVVQPQQMEADSMYRDVVVLLAYKLIQMGVVEGSDDVFVPTMIPAKA